MAADPEVDACDRFHVQSALPRDLDDVGVANIVLRLAMRLASLLGTPAFWSSSARCCNDSLSGGPSSLGIES